MRRYKKGIHRVISTELHSLCPLPSPSRCPGVGRRIQSTWQPMRRFSTPWFRWMVSRRSEGYASPGSAPSCAPRSTWGRVVSKCPRRGLLGISHTRPQKHLDKDKMLCRHRQIPEFSLEVRTKDGDGPILRPRPKVAEMDCRDLFAVYCAYLLNAADCVDKSCRRAPRSMSSTGCRPKQPRSLTFRTPFRSLLVPCPRPRPGQTRHSFPARSADWQVIRRPNGSAIGHKPGQIYPISCRHLAVLRHAELHFGNPAPGFHIDKDNQPDIGPS